MLEIAAKKLPLKFPKLLKMDPKGPIRIIYACITTTVGTKLMIVGILRMLSKDLTKNGQLLEYVR